MATDQAAEARKKAEEQRAKQEAADKERAEKAAKEAAETNASQDRKDAAAGDQPTADTPTGEPTIESLTQKLDAMSRLVETLTAQMALREGPAANEPKSAVVASPGAQMDPRTQRPGLGGVTSGPSNQPLPMSMAAGGVEPRPSGFAAWGYDPQGNKITATEYPQLKDEDVIVRRTGYYDDVIRNEGETIRGYTGPAASWFVPASVGNDPRALKRWDNLFNGRHDEGEAA